MVIGHSISHASVSVRWIVLIAEPLARRLRSWLDSRMHVVDKDGLVPLTREAQVDALQM